MLCKSFFVSLRFRDKVFVQIISIGIAGLVTTSDVIDREVYPNGFNIVITCTDKGTLPRSSSVNLFINISDANDNSPVFSRFSYRGKVQENGVGLVAVIVNATDADSGLAGDIQYSITSRCA